MTPTLTDRTVLVTGGAGFVGSHITDALVADNDVRVLDDLSNGRRENMPAGAELIEDDVSRAATLRRAVEDVDVVFHQAAMVSVPESIERPLDCHRTNTDATARLLDAARRVDARVVLASSAAVYGAPVSVPVAEDDSTDPAAPYGVSKLASDHLAEVYARQYGLETVSLRYFNVYGPRATQGVVHAFLQRALDGEPLSIHGDGCQTRDFVHVSDVVGANLRAATTEQTGVYNVGTGRRVTIRSLAELVCDFVGADSDIVHAEERQGDIRHSLADTSRARSALGFEASVDLEHGLRETLAHHRQRTVSS